MRWHRPTCASSRRFPDGKRSREAGRGGPALEVGFARRPADPHIAAVVLGACDVAVLDRDLGKAHGCETQRPVAVGGRRGSRLNEVARHHVNRSMT